MAAPAEVTLKDLSGNWVMNKNSSDPSDGPLTLQGVGWLTRKAINIATIYLAVKQYTDAAGVVHIDIEQTATGGIKGTSEKRELNWQYSSHNDHVFGNLKGRNRWINIEQLSTVESDYVPTEAENKFLSEDWIEDESENAGPNGERHIESFVQNDEKKWTARQVWGFSIIDGVRYHVRRVVLRKIGSKETIMVKLVYNYSGK